MTLIFHQVEVTSRSHRLPWSCVAMFSKQWTFTRSKP